MMTTIKLPPIPAYSDPYVCDDMREYGLAVAQAVREACCSVVYGWCESDNVVRPQRTVDAIRALKIEVSRDDQ